MNIGLVGLGKMGQAIAYRLLQAGHQVVGYDPAQSIGDYCVDNLATLAQQARIIWLMVPAGQAVDDVLAQLRPYLKSGDIIIDGGNSNYQDSVRRYEELKKIQVSFLDCGTSGGVHGKELGFSLMIGGDKESYTKLEQIFKALAAPNGYAYFGPSGAGHYVKMVHNGVEYALLQAYAEGFDLLKNGSYKDLDLAQVCRVWNNGSIIRSWIVELARQVFEQDQEFKSISGQIGENQTGQWTVAEAALHGVSMRVVQQALDIRAWSRLTGGDYATKVVAMLRNKFGGHPVKQLT